MPLLELQTRKREIIMTWAMAFTNYHVQKTTSLKETWPMASKRYVEKYKRCRDTRSNGPKPLLVSLHPHPRRECARDLHPVGAIFHPPLPPPL
jgi:hypothetical protein